MRCITCGTASCEGEHASRNEYVDTRGVWPMYVRGQLAITLVGKRHDISLDDAREVVRQMLQ